jgi:hypothetical protein
MIKKMIMMLVMVGMAALALEAPAKRPPGEAAVVAPGKAAFVAPTQEQIDQAAGDPAALRALLAGANPEQAANVVKAVIAVILQSGQSVIAQQASVAQAVSAAFSILPAAQTTAFSSALGTACGGSPVISANGGAVSAIQAVLASIGTPELGRRLAASFGDSFQAASGTLFGPSDKADDNPPVADGYLNQPLPGE